jgi:hypothetical protein
MSLIRRGLQRTSPEASRCLDICPFFDEPLSYLEIAASSSRMEGTAVSVATSRVRIGITIEQPISQSSNNHLLKGIVVLMAAPGVDFSS